VPDRLLRRGPDDPASVAWLWEHWGTTLALRHVAVASPEPRAAWHQDQHALTFWSADWTPWRALAQLDRSIRASQANLVFGARPVYTDEDQLFSVHGLLPYVAGPPHCFTVPCTGAHG
jgi:hypothetical protein